LNQFWRRKKNLHCSLPFFLFCLSVDDLSMYNQRANRRNLSAEKEKKASTNENDCMTRAYASI
jgi:hypothetical protein